MITADEVIRSRQTAIFNRVQEIEHEQKRLDLQKQALEREKEALRMEHDILDAYDDRGHISVTTTTTTTVKMRSHDKITFEDTVKKIFDNVGRPMRVTEIIHELKTFGYQWSTYTSAHNYITRLAHIERVPQCRGTYQWTRG